MVDREILLLLDSTLASAHNPPLSKEITIHSFFLPSSILFLIQRLHTNFYYSENDKWIRRR